MCWPNICERQCFTISELSHEFPQILLTILNNITTVRLGYHKFCARWFLKMLMGMYKTQRMSSRLTFTFLEWHHKYGNEFISRIIQVTDDETWVSSVNVETQELSKQWLQTLSACQKACSNCILWPEWSADGGIHATWDHSNIRNLLQNTKRTVLGYSAYSSSHLSTAGAFQLGVVWPPSLQPWSHSEWIPSVYVHEELVGITTL
jgi:hypothetical protein